MTAGEFHAVLASIGWSQRGLAERLGIEATRVRRWASGRYPVPENIAAWLSQLGDAHARAPWPDGWTAR